MKAVARPQTKSAIIAWLNLMRIGAAARGLLPFFLGTVIAWSRGYSINLPVFFLSSVAVLSIMIATFLVNEYFDYETDSANRGFHRLSGGSRVLVSDLIPRGQALFSAFLLFALSAACGSIIYFVFQTGPLTIPLGAVGILTGYFYTAAPVRLSYRGLGELAILFTCGWLATVIGYYLQTGQMSTTVSLVSLPGAFSVFLLILINEVPDMESDAGSGKRNLAVLFGRENTLRIYSVLLVVCWLIIPALIPFGAPWISGALSVTLVPLAWMNLRDIRRKPEEGRTMSRGTLEKLSVRTMLFDHTITFIYSVAFVAAGISAGRRSDALVVILLCYLFVFALEGMSLLISSMVPGRKPTPIM
jgi:1,4-dihydroxy-2-naphthoate octaprenyltransferase